MVNRVGAGFCPEPQPAGPHHIARDSVTDDLDRILMQDQPSKFYYVITGAHGLHDSSSFAFMSALRHRGRICTQQDCLLYEHEQQNSAPSLATCL